VGSRQEVGRSGKSLQQAKTQGCCRLTLQGGRARQQRRARGAGKGQYGPTEGTPVRLLADWGLA